MFLKSLHQGKFSLRIARQEDAPQMEALQQICFPTLASHEKLTAAHYQNHISIFPGGQIVITEGENIIASSSTLKIHFPEIDHHLMDVTDNLWITKAHAPDGEWLYQFDLQVRPDYRGLGLSKALYTAHQEMTTRSGMQGIITVGMTIGFQNYKDTYTIEEYCKKLQHFELIDPTVTPQRKAGFQWVQPIFNYLEDEAAGNCGIFMVWPAESINEEKYLHLLKE